MRWVLALLLVAAVARAAPLAVERAPVDLLHAERLDITDRFELVRVEIALALVDARHAGDVELSEGMLSATTRTARDDWTYSIALRERTPDAVGGGRFDVRLELDGEAMGSLRLRQAVPNPLLQEGARLTFGVGRELPLAPLFVVTVREVPVGPVHALTSAVNSTFDYVWRDDGQTQNPRILLSATDTATFVVTNGDGTSPHNFQIVDGSDPPPTTPDMDNVGDQRTLTWTPPHAGQFPYHCQYHPTMKGTIEVTS